MKILRITLAVFIIACCLALPFMTDQLLGTFRLSLPLSLPPATEGLRYALVLKNDKQITAIFPLKEIKVGFSGIKDATHFVELGILCGLLIGFPIGELSRRMFVVDLASKKAIQEGNDLKFDAQLKILKAESMMRDANTLCADYPQLKKKLAETQRALFVIREDRRDLVTAYNDRGQKIESVEKELVKAKGKIRRLEGQMERRKGQKQLTYAPDQHKL